MSEVTRTATAANVQQVDLVPTGGPMIYTLIGQAMRKIGAIGKNGTATNGYGKQMYKFRGIDAVYNALNPVMAELGIFVTPEILEQQREEKISQNGEKVTRLVYTILKVRYTVTAPDGSFIQMTVIGEGMDSGDKSANKAMSIALKYAMFQLFMIPTEEMADPDAEVHEGILPNGMQPTPQRQQPRAQQTPPPAPAAVTSTQATVPAPQPEAPKAPDSFTPKGYLLNEIAFMSQYFGISDKKEMNVKFATMRKALIADGTVPDVDRDAMTMDQAKQLVAAIHERYLGKKAS